MKKLKSSVKTAVVSTVALTSTAAIIYAIPNLNINETKTTDIGNKLKLDVEKIDSDTVKVSIDNVQDIPKSIQFSVKLDGDVELANGQSSIKDLIKPQVETRLANNEYQENSNDILTDYTYNQDSNTIDVLITAKNSLPKFGNKIEVFELDLKSSEKTTKDGGTTYKVVPNNEDEYKYLSVTNKEYNDLGVVYDDEAISLNTAPTISSSKEFITVVEGKELELTATNLGITMNDEDEDNNNLKLEVTDLSQTNKPVIDKFVKTNPGLYTLQCVAIDSTGEKSEPITIQVYVDYDKVTQEPIITRDGKVLEANITINGGEIFKPLENVKAVDAKGRELEVKVVTDKELNLDPEHDTTYVLTYTAIDSYGNEAKMQVTLNVIANKAPVISGVKNHTIKIGDSFDPRKDVVVSDEDNDIELVVDSNVNTSIAGEYKVSYSATDSKGKTTRAQSTVKVNPKTASINIMPIVIVNDTTINQGDEFNPLNIIKVYNTNKEDITSSVDIKVSGDNVDTNKDGIYNVTYVVTDKNGAKVTKKITVTVVKKVMLASEIKISNKFNSLYVGATKEISASVNKDADNQNIEWSVSNSDVLGIKVEGNTAKITAKGEGKAVVTATTTDGTNLSDSFEVTAEYFKASTINSIPTIQAEDVTVSLGKEFKPLSIVSATDKEDGDLTSSIEVIENNVDTTKEGSYIVRYKVTDTNGATATKTITVTVVKEIVLANKITISNKFNHLYIGAGKEITAGVNIEADIKAIKWSVSNSDVLDIEVNGNNAKITAKGEGKAVVTATTTDGSNLSDSFEVIVEDFTKKDVIPDTIIDIIDTNIVTPVSGKGIETSPVELEVKNVEEDDFEKFVKNLKKSKAEIVKTIENGDFTTYKIRLIKTSLFVRNSENFIELKIDNKLPNASKYKELVTNILRIDEEETPSNPMPDENEKPNNGAIINIAPTIFANDITIELDKEFNPLSIVSATDKEDGDLTSSIEVIENNVDTTKEGSYIVRYKVTDKGGATVTKTITVTVIKEVVLANKITISNKFNHLYVGASKEIIASVNEDADNQNIEWSVSNSDILDIEVKGNTVKITAKGEGSVTITATTTDGTNLSDSFEVNVQDFNNEDIIPDIIINLIDTNIVTPVSGDGNEKSPVELEVKDVKEDEFEQFVKDLKKSNSKIVDIREEDKFTVYKIKLSKFRLFARTSEYYVEIKIDNNLANASKYKEIVANILKEDISNGNEGNVSGGNTSTDNNESTSGSTGSGATNNNGNTSGGSTSTDSDVSNNSGNTSTNNNGVTNNGSNSSTENTNKVENETVNNESSTTNEQLEETTTVDNTTNEIVEESTNKSEESITNNSQVETAEESKDSNNIIAYIGVGIAAIAGVLFAKGKKD
ncbi:MAG: DUF5011 domain-containing protein [Clostridium sp.]|nr:DUF5011 domain-containing protein [Clostridium sp.]